MAATYSTSLATAKDRVRFDAGDTDVSNAALSDEEITAVLAIEANEDLATARCRDAILAKWNGASGGLSKKKVDDLELEWGSDGDAKSAYREETARIRARGVRALHPASKPSILGML